MTEPPTEVHTNGPRQAQPAPAPTGEAEPNGGRPNVPAATAPTE
jgi:hypothetical protein